MVRHRGENCTLFSVFNQAEEKKLKEYREMKVSIRVYSAQYNVFVSDSDTGNLEYLPILMSTSVLTYFYFLEFVQMLLLLIIDRRKTACSKEATTVLKK